MVTVRVKKKDGSEERHTSDKVELRLNGDVVKSYSLSDVSGFEILQGEAPRLNSRGRVRDYSNGLPGISETIWEEI